LQQIKIMLMIEKFYKYRSLENFRYFVDIILKNRLYASKYNEMNDPMEGYYYHWNGQFDESMVQKLKSDKEKLNICSLSRTKDEELMWHYYADKHKGVVIGVEVDNYREQYDIETIQYENELPFLSHSNLNVHTAKEILTHKFKSWEYEEEVRVFVKNSDFINVKVKEMIIGKKMNKTDSAFVKQLIEKINPNICLISAE